MRGYPKYINTKQDFDNLLAIPEYKARALEDLKRLQTQAVSEAKVVQVVSGSEEQKNLVTAEIDNPNPRWKQIGFKDKTELDTFMAAKEAKINGE
jgi:hypothetical protein